MHMHTYVNTKYTCMNLCCMARNLISLIIRAETNSKTFQRLFNIFKIDTVYSNRTFNKDKL